MMNELVSFLSSDKVLLQYSIILITLMFSRICTIGLTLNNIKNTLNDIKRTINSIDDRLKEAKHDSEQ